MDEQPKTVVITGASTGIGRASAGRFAREGWRVAATMRRPEEHEELGSIEGISLYRLDVTDREEVASTATAIVADLGVPHVVVNNAGYGAAGPLETSPHEKIDRQIATNLTGLIDVTRAFLPGMRESGRGVFVNITSVGGLTTFPFFSLYHATKWAVEGLTESLRYELGFFGLQAKIVEPGGVHTDFASRSLDTSDDGSTDEYTRYLTQLFEGAAARRVGYSTPEEVADVIFEAATDGTPRLRYVSGQDAEELLAARSAVPFEDFAEGLLARLGFTSDAQSRRITP